MRQNRWRGKRSEGAAGATVTCSSRLLGAACKVGRRLVDPAAAAAAAVVSSGGVVNRGDGVRCVHDDDSVQHAPQKRRTTQQMWVSCRVAPESRKTLHPRKEAPFFSLLLRCQEKTEIKKKKRNKEP